MILPNDMSIDRDDRIEPVYYRSCAYLRITDQTGMTFLIYVDRERIADLERACASLDQAVRAINATADAPAVVQTGE